MSIDRPNHNHRRGAEAERLVVAVAFELMLGLVGRAAPPAKTANGSSLSSMSRRITIKTLYQSRPYGRFARGRSSSPRTWAVPKVIHFRSFVWVGDASRMFAFSEAFTSLSKCGLYPH